MVSYQEAQKKRTKKGLDGLPAEILVEVCRRLVHPMQSKPHGHGPSMKPSTEDALACRAALARLMRTCRNLHDVAGCVLYSGYYQLWHPSDAYRFLKSLDPHANEPYYESPYARHLSLDDTRRHLVRHLDVHGNVDRRTLSGAPWTEEQAASAHHTRIEEMATAIGMPLPEGWDKSRLQGEKEPRDHAAEHINQLLLRYLSDLTSLKMTLVFNWTFDVLEKWMAEQKDHHASPFRNLRHLKVHLRSLQARSFNCLKLIMDNAPRLSTLEIYDTASYRPPQHCRLEALRDLKFVKSSMDRGTMKFTLQAVPNITHFEYQHSAKGMIADRQPPLTPQMLCHLLSNEYELTLPPPLNGKGHLVKAALPDLHRQLRTLIVDFPVYEGMEPWGDGETIRSLRHFVKLRRLSINVNSIACEARGKQQIRTINTTLETLIPETLEHLEITRMGGCLQELSSTCLPNLAGAVRQGRFGRLERVSLTGCSGSKDAMLETQLRLQDMFGRQQKPGILVTGHAE
ncbi:hypothetical protein CGRA01v4_06529 [Colletotrichum graminicola]|uniref:Uncharacterized protein n=1 Tax=Colletotrichum graminicola (strain M1.001 / M2 / FGSC 10212) TaxID=645133 RepID=E3Q235_COLGM|nr:uncharacterized protein GLRG_00280 [Colletotrichum graminicola M1.001]EFQ25136.1 hypothetical protein GLRG_00280 [Colletotrichum graminicola M1.001]WDK15248.1 hypothetical protein CGRA01v4_06529 [Colletotrichum graminicola]